MKKEQKNFYVPRTRIRAIALILAIAFLWQGIVWANPDLPKTTLAQRTLPSTENKAESFERLVLAYVNRLIHRKGAHLSTLHTVEHEWWPAIYRAAGRRRLAKDERPAILKNGGILEGVITFIFPNGHKLIFYDPNIPEARDKIELEKKSSNFTINIPVSNFDLSRAGAMEKKYLCVLFSIPRSRAQQLSYKPADNIIRPEGIKKILPSENQHDASSAGTEKEGSAISANKIALASVIGPVSALITLAISIYYYSAGLFAAGLVYSVTAGILPLMTARYIQKGLSFRHHRKDYGLIRGFEKAENIRNIRDHDPNSRGKISYYSYHTAGKLYADKEAMRRVPKLIQFIIYFHEMMHAKFKIKTELTAVTMTFCAPWIAFGAALFILTPALPPGSARFLGLFIMYNISIGAVVKFIARAIGTKETPAGDYVVKKGKWKKLDDYEIDEAISDFAHKKTLNGRTKEMMPRLDWLRGGESENIEFIPCPGRPEDIIVVKAGYEPGTAPEEIEDKIKLSKKKSFVLVIADNGPDKISKKYRRRRIKKVINNTRQILKSRRVMPGSGLTKICVRSTKYDITRLRDLVRMQRRRLARIKHHNIEREAVGGEIHDHTARFLKLLRWLKNNNYKHLQLMGDYIGRETNGFESIDFIREHMNSGEIPKLSMLMGRSEHIFLRAMLGDDTFTDNWPSMSQYGGPAVMWSLKKLAKKEINDDMPGWLKKDIRQAVDFEKLLENIIKNRGERVTPGRMNEERIKWYRFHPKLLDLADFIIENMKFVYSEDRHHNIYLIGAIPTPEKFKRHGLGGIEAFGCMENEFSKSAGNGIRLLKLMKEIWIMAHTANGKEHRAERAENIVSNILDLIEKEREKNRYLPKELISEETLSIMKKNLFQARELISRDMSGDTDKQLARVFRNLLDTLIKATRPLPGIFDTVFQYEGSPFMPPSDDGIEVKKKAAGAKQKRRIELGVNTVITPTDFPQNGFQELKHVRVLDREGKLIFLEVDTLDDKRPKSRLVLAAHTLHEIFKGQSLESMTKRKLRTTEKILDDYEGLVPERPAARIYRSLQRAADKIYSTALRVKNAMKNKAKKEILAECGSMINSAMKRLDNDDPSGLFILEGAFLHEGVSVQQQREIIDVLLKCMPPPVGETQGMHKLLNELLGHIKLVYNSEADFMKLSFDKSKIRKVVDREFDNVYQDIPSAFREIERIDAVETLSGLVSRELKREDAYEILEEILSIDTLPGGHLEQNYRSALNEIHYWISQLGDSEYENQYKRSILGSLTNAMARSKNFVKFIIKYGKKRANREKREFIEKLLEIHALKILIHRIGEKYPSAFYEDIKNLPAVKNGYKGNIFLFVDDVEANLNNPETPPTLAYAALMEYLGLPEATTLSQYDWIIKDLKEKLPFIVREKFAAGENNLVFWDLGCGHIEPVLLAAVILEEFEKHREWPVPGKNMKITIKGVDLRGAVKDKINIILERGAGHGAESIIFEPGRGCGNSRLASRYMALINKHSRKIKELNIIEIIRESLADQEILDSVVESADLVFFSYVLYKLTDEAKKRLFRNLAELEEKAVIYGTVHGKILRIVKNMIKNRFNITYPDFVESHFCITAKRRPAKNTKNEKTDISDFITRIRKGAQKKYTIMGQWLHSRSAGRAEAAKKMILEIIKDNAGEGANLLIHFLAKSEWAREQLIKISGISGANRDMVVKKLARIINHPKPAPKKKKRRRLALKAAAGKLMAEINPAPPRAREGDEKKESVSFSRELPRLINTLMAWAQNAAVADEATEEKEKILLAIDTDLFGPAQKNKMTGLFEKHIIAPLKDIHDSQSGNSAALRNALKNLVVVSGRGVNLGGKGEQGLPDRLNSIRGVKKENIAIVTIAENLPNFSDFDGTSFITAIDKSESCISPAAFLKITLFTVKRALSRAPDRTVKLDSVEYEVIKNQDTLEEEMGNMEKFLRDA